MVATQAFFHFHPETWGNDPILTSIFFKGVEPPTSGIGDI